MKPTSWILSGLLAVATAVAAHAEASGEQRAQEAGRELLGTRAPALIVKTIDGKSIDMGTLLGKQAVYLKFWATWCVPCRQQMPHFEHTFETAGPDLAVIAINTGFNDSVTAIEAYREKLGIKMPIVMDDGRLAAAFHLRVTPQHIVIGRDGRILYVGHLADASLDQALTAARSGSRATAAGTGAGKSYDPARTYDVGDSLPALSPRTIDGRRVNLRGVPAAPTVLVFLSPWCESYLATSRPEMAENCRRMREQVAAAAGDAAGDATVRWLGIASGLWANQADLRDYRRKYHVQMPLSLDVSGQLFRTFNVSQVPTALLVGSDGRIESRIAGADFADPTALSRGIKATAARLPGTPNKAARTSPASPAPPG